MRRPGAHYVLPVVPLLVLALHIAPRHAAGFYSLRARTGSLREPARGA